MVALTYGEARVGTVDSAPVATIARAPSARSRAIMVGNARASSSGSSPTCCAVSRPGATQCGPLMAPPCPRERNAGRAPSLSSSPATISASGVLPVPPAVKFPMHTTGMPGANLRPRRWRRSAARAQTRDAASRAPSRVRAARAGSPGPRREAWPPRRSGGATRRTRSPAAAEPIRRPRRDPRAR